MLSSFAFASVSFRFRVVVRPNRTCTTCGFCGSFVLVTVHFGFASHFVHPLPLPHTGPPPCDLLRYQCGRPHAGVLYCSFGRFQRGTHLHATFVTGRGLFCAFLGKATEMKVVDESEEVNETFC